MLKNRKIVLVGHDLQADIAFLRQLGYDPGNLRHLLECTDTAHMYRSFRREPHNSGLGKILADLDIAGWDLHNAGNDAVYTLQAMIAIAITALVDKQAIREREKEVIEKKIQEAMEAAAENIREDKKGWSSGGDDSDGGIPGPTLKEERPQYDSPKSSSRGNPGGGANRGGAAGSKTSWRQRGAGYNPGRKHEPGSNSTWW